MSAPQAAPSLLLVRATELIGLPVVSLTRGEALAEIKDVLYDPDAGALLGFTLNKRGGLFSGPLKSPLPISAVHGVGRDAVVVADTDGSADISTVLEGVDHAAADAASKAARNVLGNDVITEGGDRLGTVDDLIVEVGLVGETHGAGSGGTGDVVGYQLTADPAPDGKIPAAQLVPLPYALAVSGTHLVVPASVEAYMRDDLSQFGKAVAEFRATLGGHVAGS